MLINLRNALMAGKAPRVPHLSLQKSGTASEGFYATGLSVGTFPQTLTCWYRYQQLPSRFYDRSRVVFKYGNASNGCGFGASGFSDTGANTHKALAEAKYWANMTNPNWTAYDTNWHHLAFVIKSGSYPFRNAIYCDGTVATMTTEQSGSIVMPTSRFHIGGRDSGDVLNCKVQVCRICLFAGELDISAIVADFESGDKEPKGNLIHYWTGETVDGRVVDKIGTWHLTASAGCTISADTPWA